MKDLIMRLIPSTLTKQTSLDSRTVSAKEATHKFHICEDPDDPYCPMKLLKLYASKLHPGGTKWYYKVASVKDRRKFKKQLGTAIGICEDIWLVTINTSQIMSLESIQSRRG